MKFTNTRVDAGTSSTMMFGVMDNLRLKLESCTRFTVCVFDFLIGVFVFDEEIFLLYVF